MRRLVFSVASALIAITSMGSGAASLGKGSGQATEAEITPVWLPPAALSTAPSHEPSVSLNARGDAVAVWRDRDTAQITARIRAAASGKERHEAAATLRRLRIKRERPRVLHRAVPPSRITLDSKAPRAGSSSSFAPRLGV
jgi:hypothetical protein